MIPETTPPITAQRRTLTLDIAHYQSMLDAPDLSEDQKAEMIEALWLLVVSFVTLDYDICAETSCGQLPETAAQEPEHALPVLDSMSSRTIERFTAAANTPHAPKQSKEAS